MIPLHVIDAPIELFERAEIRQHARDRVAEREDIELDWLDLGGEQG